MEEVNDDAVADFLAVLIKPVNVAGVKKLGGKSRAEANVAFDKDTPLIVSRRLDIVQAVFVNGELALENRSLLTRPLVLDAKVHDLVAARESSSTTLVFAAEGEFALGDQICDFSHLF